MSDWQETTQAANQAAFDLSLAHIRWQGRPSTSGGKCRYLSGDGCGCGIYPFIVDYHDGLEGKSFSKLARLDPEHLSEVAKAAARGLMATLQDAHDVAAKSDEFMLDYEYRMKRGASRFDLDYQPA